MPARQASFRPLDVKRGPIPLLGLDSTGTTSMVMRLRRVRLLAGLQDAVRSQATSAVLAGTGWSVAGNACARGLAVLVALGAARVLGRDGFGVFSLVQLTITTTATVAAFQMGT